VEVKDIVVVVDNKDIDYIVFLLLHSMNHLQFEPRKLI